jgi:hypothetical protein
VAKAITPRAVVQLIKEPLARLLLYRVAFVHVMR